MSDKKRWSEPDWEWLPDTGYDENPFNSSAIATAVLLAAGIIFSLFVSLWYLFRG